MKMQMYVVMDAQAEATTRPMFFERDAVAIRWFKGVVHDEGNQMGRTPEDFTVYRVGEYDDEFMLLEGHEAQRLINGLEAKQHVALDQEAIADLQAQIRRIENGGEHAEA